MTEKELDRAVRELLTVYGLWGYSVYDSRRSAPGWPDWCIVGRRVLFRELKTSRGLVTREQKLVGYRLKAAGQDWAVWRPADLASGRIAEEIKLIRR